MTEKQLFGVVVRGMGVWFAAKAIIQTVSTLAMMPSYLYQDGRMDSTWLLRELINLAMGFALIRFAPGIIERCYKKD